VHTPLDIGNVTYIPSRTSPLADHWVLADGVPFPEPACKMAYKMDAVVLKSQPLQQVRQQMKEINVKQELSAVNVEIQGLEQDLVWLRSKQATLQAELAQEDPSKEGPHHPEQGDAEAPAEAPKTGKFETPEKHAARSSTEPEDALCQKRAKLGSDQ